MDGASFFCKAEFEQFDGLLVFLMPGTHGACVDIARKAKRSSQKAEFDHLCVVTE
jgi:hypothetical protein